VGPWRCEVKFDGYRAIALLNDGRAELWSRTRNEMSPDYPEVVAALSKVRCRNATLDGEIVALDTAGHSRFQLLQARELAGERPPIVYYAFDLLHLDGVPQLDRPIQDRRAALESLLGRAKLPLQLSPGFVVQPADLMTEVRRQGLEGIVAKRQASKYEPDRRSGAWLKCKILNEQEFVIGGFTAPRQSRQFFGAILAGYYEAGELRYAGKVGSGFDAKWLKSLHGEFQQRRIDRCPFADLPRPKKPRFGQGMTRAEMSRVSWVRPDLVAQIRFGEWTHDALLRQPVFVGLRRDKPPQQVRREPASKAGRRDSTHHRG